MCIRTYSYLIEQVKEISIVRLALKVAAKDPWDMVAKDNPVIHSNEANLSQTKYALSYYLTKRIRNFSALKLLHKGKIDKCFGIQLRLTWGTLNQQGWPRRVWESSMISSSTRKKAWSWNTTANLDELLNCLTDILPDNIGGQKQNITHSMHQPRVQARNSSSLSRVSAPFNSL